MLTVVGYEMKGPLEAMYKAGKQFIPVQAQSVAAASNQLSESMTSVNVQAAYAGDPPLLTAMLKIAEEVYIGVRRTASSMDAAAQAIVATADDFVKTDDRAAEDYKHLSPALQRATIPTHALEPGVQPGGWSEEGAPDPDPNPPTRPGRGGLEYHPEDYEIESTPDPESTGSDQQERDETEQQDKNETPVPQQPSEVGR